MPLFKGIKKRMQKSFLAKLDVLIEQDNLPVSIEDCALDLEELIPFLTEKTLFEDELCRKYYIKEMIKLLPECYEKEAYNITFFEMEDKTTVNLDVKPYEFHNNVPFKVAHEMLDILNKIKEDKNSSISVSSLVNMIYIKHNGKLYGTQFKDVKGVYLTSEGFVYVP